VGLGKTSALFSWSLHFAEFRGKSIYNKEISKRAR
jgi:hypothetical protein